jgi:hypothetical protein
MLSIFFLSLLGTTAFADRTAAPADANANKISTDFSYLETSALFHNSLFDRATCSSLSAIRTGNTTVPTAGEWIPWSHNGRCMAAPADDPNGNAGKPFCLYTSASFAGRRGISIVTSPERAAALAKRMAFSASPRRTSPAPSYDAADPPFAALPVPGKGIGVVATRHIQHGEIIMANTPALLVDYAAIDAFGDGLAYDFLFPAVTNLPKAHQEAYLNLSYHVEADDLPHRINEIMNTNSFDIDILDGNDGIFFGVFTESRFPGALI